MRVAAPSLIAGFLIAWAAPRAAAQSQEYDLAVLLAERHWFDLATEIFVNIKKSGSLSHEKRVDGEFGLAWIESIKAESETKPEAKLELYNQATETILKFIETHGNHPRRSEALSVFGDLLQKKGKFLLGAGKSLPNAAKEAEEAFRQAQTRFLSLVENLKKSPVEPPPADVAESDPRYQAWMAWDQKMMTAKYNYGVSLFHQADAYKGDRKRFEEMKDLIDKMIAFFEQDFMWDYERYLLAYSAFIYMGRGCQLLAENSETAKAEEYWKKCFSYVEKPIFLLSDPANRKLEGVRELALESAMFTLRAKMAYGDTLRGGKASSQYQDAVKIAEKVFKHLPPTAKREPYGVLVRIEQARALCKSGRIREGTRNLQEIRKDAAGDPALGWVDNFVIDIIGEYAGESDPKLILESADNMYERGPAYFSKAIAKYRSALSVIRKPEDRRYIPHCWKQIAECYYWQDRWIEAAQAYDMIMTGYNGEFLTSPEATKAVVNMKTALFKVQRATGLPEDRARYERFVQWANSKFPNELGDGSLREEAVTLENEGRKARDAGTYAGQFAKAIDNWSKLAAKPSSPFHEEAVFSVAYNAYLHAEMLSRTARTQEETEKVKPFLQKTIEYAGRHLAVVDRMNQKDSIVVRNALASIYFASRACLDPAIDQPSKVLELSEGFESKLPNPDPAWIMRIYELRIEAHRMLAKLDGESPDLESIKRAEKDLDTMRDRYQKDPRGERQLMNALRNISEAYRLLASKMREENPGLAEAYSIRAAEVMFQYFELSREEPKGEEILAMAETFFDTAQRKLDQARAADSKEEMAKAREMFGKAHNLYNRYLLTGKLETDVETAIRGRMTDCLAKSGKFDEALSQLKDVVDRDPQMAKGGDWEAYLDCLMMKADSMQPGTERNQLIEEAKNKYGQLAAMLSRRIDKHYWRILYKYADAMFRIDPDGLRNFFINMEKRGTAPAWDGGEFEYAAKFEALREKNEKRLPNKE